MARKSRKPGAAATKTGRAANRGASSGRRWKCAVYCRLSTRDNGGAPGDSIESQESVVRAALARMDGVDVVGAYRDNGFTGTEFGHRPGFNRMMADVQDGKVDCIAVKDLSRFGRNHLEAGYYIERILPYLGVRFIAVADGFDSADGRGVDMAVPLKNIINEMHSRDTGRKSRESYLARARSGSARLIRAPYGYAVDPDDPTRLAPDPETAPVVMRMFADALAGAMPTAIARSLEADGVPAPEGGGTWPFWTVRRILTNPAYAGDLVLHKHDSSIFRAVRWATVPEGERIVHADAHEPLVGRREFEEVQRAFVERAEKWGAGRAANAGLRERVPDYFKDCGVWCAECGSRMTIARRVEDCGFAGASYRCARCGAPSKIAEPLLRIVVGDEIRRQLALAGMGGGDPVPLSRLRDEAARKLREAEARREAASDLRLKVYEDFCLGRMAADEWESAKEPAEAALAAATAEADRCRRALASLMEPGGGTGGAADGGAGGGFPVGPDGHVGREAIAALVERVDVGRGGAVTVTLKFDIAADAGKVGRRSA